jgi:exopolyphosphatase/guanosine-5'-triphosphate,3'-diphosphate pyrophosphatase
MALTVTEIVPRWEWRTFGSHFGVAEEFFAALHSTGITESDEVYFRSGRGAIAKIRDGLMDLKALQEVSPQGLEQWIPVMKEEFPLSADVVRHVLDMIEVSAIDLDRERYTLDQLLSEVIAPHPEVAAVGIHKRRARYTIEGCSAELTDLIVDGRPLRTIAIESENPSAVLSAVRVAGLVGHLNHNFVRLLTALLEDEGPRFGVVDIGTNSVKFHVAERRSDGSWATVVDRAEVTRLGEGQSGSGPISNLARERTAEAVAGMVEEARQERARALAVVGTAALRSASNSSKVIEALRRRTGLDAEPISGEEESRLAYLAVKAGLGPAAGSLVVFDTGGGSSQFTFGSGETVDERFSVPVGAVRFTEAFALHDVVDNEQLSQARSAISADLADLDGRPRPDALVGMGGAITNLTAVSLEMESYDPDRIQGATLERSEVERQIDMYMSTPLEERRSIVGLQPKRAEVILAGACIVATVMEKLGEDRLTVSDRGLRHGVLSERFGI